MWSKEKLWFRNCKIHLLESGGPVMILPGACHIAKKGFCSLEPFVTCSMSPEKHVLALKVEVALRSVWAVRYRVLHCPLAHFVPVKQCHAKQAPWSNLCLLSGIFHILGQGKSSGTF